MKHFSKLLISIFMLTAPFASVSEALVTRCRIDQAACPGGNHMRCVQFGWCGPNCGDYCSDGTRPVNGPNPRDLQQCSSEEEIATNPDCSCIETCGRKCSTNPAFCGSW